jgi:hypothetical protein
MNNFKLGLSEDASAVAEKHSYQVAARVLAGYEVRRYSSRLTSVEQRGQNPSKACRSCQNPFMQPEHTGASPAGVLHPAGLGQPVLQSINLRLHGTPAGPALDITLLHTAFEVP